ncbi:MAG: UpxY family transcription antiterminator [Ferruginibacter sp.]
MKRKWYAVYTKPNCGKKVAALLSRKNIENYCPLNRIVNFQDVRKKMVYEPLLSNIVLVFITEAEMDVIKKTSSVLNFVYWLGKPVVIKSDEIVYIRNFTSEYSNIKLEKTAVNPDETGQVTSEPHLDITNKHVVKNMDIRLSLPSLGYVMIAQVEKANINVFNYGYERNKLVS